MSHEYHAVDYPSICRSWDVTGSTLRCLHVARRISECGHTHASAMVGLKRLMQQLMPCSEGG
jgi:hypothetical protein